MKAGTIRLTSEDISSTDNILLKFVNDGSFQATDSNPIAASGLPTNKPISKQNIDGIAKDSPEGSQRESSNLRSITEDIFAVQDQRNSYVLTSKKLTMRLIVVEIGPPGLVDSSALVGLRYNIVDIFELNIQGRDISLTKTVYIGPLGSNGGILINTYQGALDLVKRLPPAAQGTTPLTLRDQVIYTGSF